MFVILRGSWKPEKLPLLQLHCPSLHRRTGKNPISQLAPVHMLIEPGMGMTDLGVLLLSQ